MKTFPAEIHECLLKAEVPKQTSCVELPTKNQ